MVQTNNRGSVLGGGWIQGDNACRSTVIWLRSLIFVSSLPAVVVDPRADLSLRNDSVPCFLGKNER
eukprot:3691112-Lingulodinium_polyedra.AAC.1